MDGTTAPGAAAVPSGATGRSNGRRARFDVESIDYRWSTQDRVSVDGVPSVGRHAPGADHVYLATGFGGRGMTNGVVAGRLLSDLVLGRTNPRRDVYTPNRFALGASWRNVPQHNVDAVRDAVRGRLKNNPTTGARDLRAEEATFVDVAGNPVGVYRDEENEVHAVLARCTHMSLRWNDGEATWDRPCHGSRFDHDGSVIDTPAVEDLEPHHVGGPVIPDRDGSDDRADGPSSGLRGA